MDEALRGLPVESFVPPTPSPTDTKPILRGFWQGGETYTVDKLSGKLATDYTPLELREEKVIRQVHSILYWLDKDNPNGPRPSQPQADPQFRLWEAPVRAWALSQNLTDENSNNQPTETDDIHRPELAPKIKIITPRADNRYHSHEPLMVQFDTERSHAPIVQADFFLNGLYLGSVTDPPFTFIIQPEQLADVSGSSELKVAVYDSNRNKGEDMITVQFE